MFTVLSLVCLVVFFKLMLESLAESRFIEVAVHCIVRAAVILDLRAAVFLVAKPYKACALLDLFIGDRITHGVFIWLAIQIAGFFVLTLTSASFVLTSVRNPSIV